MGLIDEIERWRQQITIRIYIGGRPVNAISGSCSLGFRQVTASADITLADKPSFIRFNDPVQVFAGYGGFTEIIFTGAVVGRGRRFWPFTNRIAALGPMRRANRRNATERTYSNQTDQAIVADVLSAIGITNVSIDGDSELLGTARPLVFRVGDTAAQFLRYVDEPLSYFTFDGPDGIVRRRKITTIPAAAPALHFVQGQNILEIDRPTDTLNIRNVVVVTGLPQEGFTPSATRVSDNPLLEGASEVFEIRSDAIQTNALASKVAAEKMPQVNRIFEQISVRTVGDPRIRPGGSVGILAPQVDIDTEQPFWIAQVTHRWDASSYITEALCEGGQGEAGYELNQDPEAVLTYRVTKEGWEDGGVPATFYTVNADGSGSWDPDGQVTAYAWSNNKNADTSSEPTYATKFTQAELDAATKPKITLQVTDNDGNTDTVTAEISAHADAILTRELHVAADNQAESSSEGGVSWGTFDPGAVAVRSTPEIAGDGHSYWGLVDGRLYRSDDHLATAPTLVHTFSAAVLSIWIHELDANRVSVGLANGEVWRTLDASEGASSTWVLRYTFTDAVNALQESVFQRGQYRVASGNAIWITFDDFASVRHLITFDAGATAQHLATSPFANYGCATNATESTAVKREDGVGVALPAGITSIFTITHAINADVLWAAGVSGTDTLIFRKPADSEPPTFAQIATIPGGGQPHRLIRDGDSPLTLYLAAEHGLYKSYDGGKTWVTMRSGNGPYYQVGYGSAPWTPIAETVVVSNTADARVLDIGVGGTQPDGWNTRLDFDDSGWSTPADADDPLGIAGTETISSAAGDHADGVELLFRHVFALPAGVVTRATFTFRADDLQMGAWINGVFAGQELTPTTGGPPFDLGPDLVVDVSHLLKPGENNLIAVWTKNARPGGGVSPTWASYKLEIR